MNQKKKLEDNVDGDKILSPYQSSPRWAVESVMLDIYFLLAHRIKGLGWSLTDFWKCDTWTTSKLYCMELDLIDKENDELNTSEDEKNDSEEAKDMMNEMFGI